METYTANLYLFTDIQSVKRSKGHFMWLWEFTEKISGEMIQKFEPPKTVSSEKFPDASKIVEDSRKEANMDALINALEHFTGHGAIDIYTNDSSFAAVFQNHWLESWQKNGWKNSQDKEVDERWKRIYELLTPHNLVDIRTERHSYTSWFENELQIRKLESDKEKTITENLTIDTETHLRDILERIENTDILENDNIAKALFNMYEMLFEKMKSFLPSQNTGTVKIENDENSINTASDNELKITNADKC